MKIRGQRSLRWQTVARDQLHLFAKTIQLAERGIDLGCISANKLLPSRPLVFRLVSGCTPGQSGEECRDERFWQGPFDLAFHLFWIAGATIAATTRSDLFHKAFVGVAAVSFIVYIGALFADLH